MRGILSLLRLALVLMQVVVLSAATGELVWEYSSGSLWRARGWELRMWLCEAIHCGLYFSVVLFVRQMLLCDIAYIGEYAEGNVLTVYMLRREIDNPSDYDALQVENCLAAFGESGTVDYCFTWYTHEIPVTGDARQ